MFGIFKIEKNNLILEKTTEENYNIECDIKVEIKSINKTFFNNQEIIEKNL